MFYLCVSFLFFFASLFFYLFLKFIYMFYFIFLNNWCSITRTARGLFHDLQWLSVFQPSQWMPHFLPGPLWTPSSSPLPSHCPVHPLLPSPFCLSQGASPTLGPSNSSPLCILFLQDIQFRKKELMAFICHRFGDEGKATASLPSLLFSWLTQSS